MDAETRKMTNLKSLIDKLRELESKATKDWHVGHISEQLPDTWDIDGSVGSVAEEVYGPDGRLILEMRSALPLLLKALDVYREAFNSIPDIAKNYGVSVDYNRQHQPWAQEANTWLRAQNIEIFKQLSSTVDKVKAEVDKILEGK